MWSVLLYQFSLLLSDNWNVDSKEEENEQQENPGVGRSYRQAGSKKKGTQIEWVSRPSIGASNTKFLVFLQIARRPESQK
jgi:hypothetical protein